MWENIQILINSTNFVITSISVSINIFIGFMWLKHKFDYLFNTRYLKKLLGFKNEEVVITQSVFEPSMISGITHNMITYESALGLVNVTTMLKTCNYKYRIYEESSGKSDEFNIGGPTCNKKVNVYMVTFFPNFKFVTPLADRQKYDKYPINKHFIEYSQNDTAFKIYKKHSGDVVYNFKIDSKYNDIIFLIKLTSQDFGGNFEKTVFITFGGFNKGSLYSSHFLKIYYKKLYKDFQNNHFFIAIPFNNIDNSFDWSKGIIDLTSIMFNDNTQ